MGRARSVGWARLAPLAGRGLALLAAVVVLTFGVLQVLDHRHAERPVGSDGYGWIEWKFQFGALFRGYDYNTVRFLLERTAHIPYESSAYLGGFVLYGLLAVGGLALLARQRQRSGQLLPALPAPGTETGPDFLLLLLAALPLLLIGLGETIELDGGNYVINDYLNPFFWLHKLTERITQFRALGRFIWPFWWALVLSFGWYAGLAWRQAAAQGGRRRQLLWIVLAVLAGNDALNAGKYYHTYTQRDNLFAEPATDELRQLVGWPEAAHYQALLPLPFYYVGTKVDDVPCLVVDPDDPHCNHTYQLGLITGLPLMPQKATRTPGYQAVELQSMFLPGGPAPALLARLDQRPILVFLDSAYYNGQNTYYRDLLKDRPEMLALFNRVPDFIREQGMYRLRHQGNWSLYEWQPRKS
ncbi:hypothetical protein [Hymenobacter sp. BRD67]|uniref:hypothetical protein n=1 Tax=Hymenobacter sp. BRD67 TaxID=2675877 RepID=UPI001567B320|nr:hypothetical protein [Hymenobacter sp. BRD67]QKG52503.1 hypothetical protein GKZ67_07690 [Hymenobacter sp. BRD67]